MKVKSSLSHKLRNLFDSNKEVRDFLPYAIAKRLAFALPISDELSDLHSFYSKFCYKRAIDVISEINEKIVFNTNETAKTVYIIWNTRCQLAFSPESIDFLSLLESAKTGLISTQTIDRLHEIKNKAGGNKAMSMLDKIMSDDIKLDVEKTNE